MLSTIFTNAGHICVTVILFLTSFRVQTCDRISKLDNIFDMSYIITTFPSKRRLNDLWSDTRIIEKPSSLVFDSITLDTSFAIIYLCFIWKTITAAVPS